MLAVLSGHVPNVAYMRVAQRLGLIGLLLGTLAGCGGSGASGDSGPKPDFTIAPATSSLTMLAGTSTDLTVSVQRIGGHTSSISLSLEGTPTGIAGAGVIAAGSTSGTLTITAGQAAESRALTIRGTDGTVSHTASPTVALNVVARGPGENKITGLAIKSANHPIVQIAEQQCALEQSASGGHISAILPGGTDPRVAVAFTTDGGTVTANGETISSPSTIDLSVVRQLVVTDWIGNERRYVLDIGDTGLPSVFVRTSGGVPIESRDFYVTGDITIMGGSTDYAVALPTSGMKIKGRGNSTWDQPKKPYRFTLDASAPVLGLPAAKNWVLLANHYDMSLMRTSVVFEAARVLTNLAFTPSALSVDLYLNGRYDGTYAIAEQLEIGASRIAIESPTTAVDTGYWIEANSRSVQEGGVAGVDFFTTNSGQIFDYKSPKAGTITPEQKAYIQAMVQRIEDGVSSGVPADVDVPSFIDWLILEEVFKNQDSYFLSSVHLYRDRGQKLRMGPAWDFDLAAGNSNYGEIGGFPLNDPHGWFPKYYPWYDGLFQQLPFSTAFKARWNEIRAPLKARVMASIDRQELLLAKSQQQNFRRWPILGIGLWPTPPVLIAADTWPEQVEALRTWMDRRFEWMDAELNRLYPW
jgi:hypothetical protein